MLTMTCFYHLSRSESIYTIARRRRAFTHLLALE